MESSKEFVSVDKDGSLYYNVILRYSYTIYISRRRVLYVFSFDNWESVFKGVCFKDEISEFNYIYNV